MIVREANSNDYNKLNVFFKKIYRENHPLHQQEFWEWQYGDKEFGRSFICLNDTDQIVGHVGANFQGGLAWIINVYLDSECRGKGILGKLYALARNYFPLAATAANEAGLGLYRNMRWIRYYDLLRFVKINPKFINPDFNEVCSATNVNIESFIIQDTHYFKQPGVIGLLFDDGSRAISQVEVGGLRVVEVSELNQLEQKAWDLGYHWIDYITSWNDLKCKNFELNGWDLDFNSVVPWRLNPLEENYFCDITFLSEEPLDKNYVVQRSYSDHGRIGSLKQDNK